MGKIIAYYAMPHPPIIIPEVGRGQEEKIKETSDACNKVADEISNIEPDTIIIVTPHGPVFGDAIALSYESKIKGNLGKFRASDIAYELDINLGLTKKIMDYSKSENILTVGLTEESAATYGINYELDHGTIVPLYFIHKKYPHYKIVHITYGMLSQIELYNFGIQIKKAVEDCDTNAVFIASGDLSHKLLEEGPYNYSPHGEKFDNELVSLLEKGNVVDVFNMSHTTIKEAAECGLRSYYVMLGAMNNLEIKGNLLSYEGPFGVGYCVFNFSTSKSKKNVYDQLVDYIENRYNDKLKNEDPYVRLARESLIHYLEKGNYIDIPSYVTDELKEVKRAVFVSLKKEGNLRGCIGSTSPTMENVAKEIIKYAVEAGVRDPRFLPVRIEELKMIDFSVDILTEPRKATRDELDPKKYGVIVRSGLKSGLLLPDLEGVESIEHQLDIVLQKAGIDSYDEYSIEKFEVLRHK
ncbi:AmmeMemoRadiSam system protein A [Mycoplasmatota bacterium WC44]